MCFLNIENKIPTIWFLPFSKQIWFFLKFLVFFSFVLVNKTWMSSVYIWSTLSKFVVLRHKNGIKILAKLPSFLLSQLKVYLQYIQHTHIYNRFQSLESLHFIHLFPMETSNHRFLSIFHNYYEVTTILLNIIIFNLELVS